VVGAYGFESDNHQVGALGSPLSYDVYGQVVPTKSYALFGQITQPLDTRTRVIAGARYTRDKRTEYYGILAKDGSYDSGLQTASTADSAFTWKLGIERDLAPSSMAYLSASTGYKAGGFSTAALPPVAYKPEHLLALEVGTKNRFLDNTVQLNAAVYAYRYRNHQLQYVVFEPSANPNDPAGTSQFALWVTNARTASNYGAEAELKWQFTPADQFKASLAYIDAHYGQFDQASLQSLAGTRMANTARLSGSLGYEHEFALDGGASLTASASTRLTQNYRITPDLSMDNAVQRGYGIVDASLTWRSADGHWTSGLWGRNLGNRAVSTYALPLGRVMLGAPRTLGINLNYTF
jgi:iron complex outermembrane recepter protein